MEEKNLFRETAFIKFCYSLVKGIFGPVARLIWVKRVEGIENIPRGGPCLIAANHNSYFDFICLTAISPRRIYYLSAEKFFKSIKWRLLMKITGQIKVERQSKDKREVFGIVLSALRQGKAVGIFPEGARSPDGQIKKPFTGVAKFALMAEVPVVPVGIEGTFEIMSRYDSFPKFVKKAVIKIGRPMHFQKHYGKCFNDEILQEITREIMAVIIQLAK